MSSDQLAKVDPFSGALVERPEQVIERIGSARDLVVQIQQKLMKPGVHYGILPGTQKPMLLKDGADLLNQAFRLEAREENVQDLSTHDERRYQVTVGIYDVTGRRLGFGIGVCSTSEDKYKWKKAYRNEYDAAAVDRRRTKEYPKDDGGKNVVFQIRTEPADLDNTVLQMATKRAHVQATRQVHAVSDIFADIGLDDLPADQRDQLLLGDRRVKKPQPKAKEKAKEKPAAPAAGETGQAAATGQADAKAEGGAAVADTAEPPAAIIPKEAWDQVREALHDRGTISLPQSKRLFAIARDNGWDPEQLDIEMRAGLGVERDEEGKYPIPTGRAYDLTVGLFTKAPK